MSSESTASDSSEEEKSKYGYCYTCGKRVGRDGNNERVRELRKLEQELTEQVIKLKKQLQNLDVRRYTRHTTDEERKAAVNESRKRWEERNKDYLRKKTRERIRRLRARRKLEKEMLVITT